MLRYRRGKTISGIFGIFHTNSLALCGMFFFLMLGQNMSSGFPQRK